MLGFEKLKKVLPIINTAEKKFSIVPWAEEECAKNQFIPNLKAGARFNQPEWLPMKNFQKN
jgi:hypothetical protein